MNALSKEVTSCSCLNLNDNVDIFTPLKMNRSYIFINVTEFTENLMTLEANGDLTFCWFVIVFY